MASDLLWRAAFGGVVTLAVSKARREWAVGLSAIASVACVGSPWLLVALASLALAVVSMFNDHRSRPLAAVIGLLGALALLHIPPTLFFGFPSLLATVAVLPVMLSAYERSDRVVRRQIRLTILSLGLVVVVALLGAAVAAATTRSAAQRAVDEARSGIALLNDGERDESIRQLATARRSFADATTTLDVPWAWPGLVLPILGPNLRATREAIDAGAAVVASAQTAVASAPYDDLRMSGGRVDLGRISTMQGPVLDLQSTLGDAIDRLEGAESGWLVAPIANPLRTLFTQLTEVAADVDTAAVGLMALPRMLGAERPTTYLVEFASTAETRNLGGFMGSWGLLGADQGRLTFGSTDSVASLNSRLAPRFPFVAPEDYRQRYAIYNPDLFAQNWTVSPDFPTDASVSAQLFEQAMSTRVDGVMMIDPEGVAALLQLTGPIRVPGIAIQLTAENVVSYLALDQYLQFAGRPEARKDQLDIVASTVFDALTRMEVPGFRRLADVLGPAVRGGHLLLTTFDTSTDEFLARIGMDGRFPRPDGGDLFSIRTANANPNKADSFLRRSIALDTTVDPRSGEVGTDVTIVLTNDAPSSGLPPYVIGNDLGNPSGSNSMYLSVYSVLDLVSAEFDGRPRVMNVQSEFGMPVYTAWVTVPSRSSVSIRIRLQGELSDIVRTHAYSLVIPVQPMLNDDVFQVSVRSTLPGSPVSVIDQSTDVTRPVPLAENWSGRFVFAGR